MYTVLRSSASVGVALALSLTASSAAADALDGVGLGPLVAYGSDGSFHLGWEVGVSGYYAFGKMALGGSYRVNHPKQEGPANFHYLAWEPWLYVGGTLGLAFNERADLLGIYGLWEGLPMAIGRRGVFDTDDALWVVSIAVGWRGIGYTHQFYITPKFWRLHGLDFFS